jgi:hypothetical protein
MMYPEDVGPPRDERLGPRTRDTVLGFLCVVLLAVVGIGVPILLYIAGTLWFSLIFSLWPIVMLFGVAFWAVDWWRERRR